MTRQRRPTTFRDNITCFLTCVAVLVGIVGVIITGQWSWLVLGVIAAVVVLLTLLLERPDNRS
uniref:hypothetical protein n=1 Tax=Pseudonocardia sp. CA-138482 TaxID=3240023 RepID=UPI003F49287E